MSVIKVTLPPGELPINGKQVSFKAPCSCTAAEAIQIEGVNYTVCDALGRCVTGGRGVWESGEIISVILDTEKNRALVQNGATLLRDELLSAETAALCGLDETAVPDDAFRKIWPLAANALPRDGSKAMTGPLNIKQVNNGYTLVNKNHSTSADYGTQIKDFDSNGNSTILSLRANNQVATLSFNDKTQTVLHTGNYSDYALPRDGSAVMTGNLNTQRDNAQGTFGMDGDSHSFMFFNVFNKSDWDHRRTLMFSSIQNSPSLSRALVLGSLDDGTWKEYPFLHTGNFEQYGSPWVKLGTVSFNSQVTTTSADPWFKHDVFPNLRDMIGAYTEVAFKTDATCTLIHNGLFANKFEGAGATISLRIGRKINLPFVIASYTVPAGSPLGTYTGTVNQVIRFDVSSVGGVMYYIDSSGVRTQGCNNGIDTHVVYPGNEDGDQLWVNVGSQFVGTITIYGRNRFNQ